MLRALLDLGTQFARDWFATNETNTMESSSHSDFSSTDESDGEKVRKTALATDDDPEVVSEADEPAAAPTIPNVAPVIAKLERRLPGGLGCQAKGGCKPPNVPRHWKHQPAGGATAAPMSRKQCILHI